MSDEFTYNSDQNAYVFQGSLGDQQFRVVVPGALVDDELGDDASETDRLNWLRNNLPQILQAYTARAGGGRVKEPWDRVLVEELD